MKMCNNKIKRR